VAQSSLSNRQRFALVHDWLTIPGGSEDVFREINDLFPGVVFTSQWDAHRVPFLAGREVRSSFVQRMPLALTKHYLYAPILPYIYRGFDLSEFDVVLSDSHSFAHGVRKRPGGLHINYYHTPARSLWVPEVDPRASSPMLRWLAARMRVMDRIAARNPDLVIANSRTVAERIKQAYDRDVDAVIYPPVHVDRWIENPRKSEDLGFLYLGRLISYKRVDLAIEAAMKMGVPLQVVGEGPLEKSLRRKVGEHANIVFHGRLKRSDLAELVSRCRALIFPGVEDFGIVPVEAMAAGLPVVAYGTGGATETILPEFGEFFHEQTPDALIAAMERVNSRRFDTEAMRAHTRQFSVDRFREEYGSFVESSIARWSA